MNNILLNVVDQALLVDILIDQVKKSDNATSAIAYRDLILKVKGLEIENTKVSKEDFDK